MKNRIAVIEDTFSLRNSLKLFFDDDYDVDTFATGEDLIHRFNGDSSYLSTLSCCVVDYQLPGINGRELIEYLHKQDTLLSFVLLTGYATIEITKDVANIGASIRIVYKNEKMHDDLTRYVPDMIAKTQENRSNDHALANKDDLDAAIVTLRTAKDLADLKVRNLQRAVHDATKIIPMETREGMMIYQTLHGSLRNSTKGKEGKPGDIIEHLSAREFKALVSVTSNLKVKEDCKTSLRNDQLVAMVMNVVKNSLDYANPTFEKPVHVHVRTTYDSYEFGVLEKCGFRIMPMIFSESAKGPWVEIVVIDDGPGIDEDILNDIFSPTKESNKSRGKGTGIGMPSVLRTVNSAEGHIAIRSELGKGTEVRFILPLKLEAKK